jgi:hypothetical protein
VLFPAAYKLGMEVPSGVNTLAFLSIIGPPAVLKISGIISLHCFPSKLQFVSIVCVDNFIGERK